jgi:hypothetical protein
MASLNSVYSKIQVVLDTAKGAETSSWKELQTKIKTLRSPGFMTRQYDKEHDSIVYDVSVRGINRALKLCIKLRLIAENGSLTEAGRRAVRHSLFEKVLSEQIHSYLENNGIKVSVLNNILAKSLHSDPMIMPTSAELWQRVNSKLPLLAFSQLLTLYAQCGHAETFQKKLFLRFSD